MKKANLGAMAIGAAIMTGCVASDDPIDEPIDDERIAVDGVVPGAAYERPEAGTVTNAYSPWYYIAGWHCSVYVRACKTSTRINWQFTGNTKFALVTTFGNGISPLTSNIDGVASGSKYRTRGGTGFAWVFDDTSHGCGTISYGISIEELPGC